MRVLVTGGSGYLGTRLLRDLTAGGGVDELVDLDLRPPQEPIPGVTFVKRSVTEDLRDVFRKHAVDTAVHLAWIVDPMHDARRQREICIGGTRRFLEACGDAGVEQVLFTSSATAYGANPAHVTPLDESTPLLDRHHYQYSAEKREAEGMLRDWALAHPGAIVQVARPTVVAGEHASSFIFRTMDRSPSLRPAGRDPGIQLVPEDDAAAALAAILRSRLPGAYNVTADGDLRLSEVNARLGIRAVPVPLPVLYAIVAVAWHLRLPGLGDAPPGFMSFVTHPWTVSNRRLKEEVGFRFRLDGRGTLDAYASGRRPRRG